ncbi:unnamed protein product [Ectocarpus sp. 4 AP-2014]
MAVSEQLASFSSDFESKILRPVREKRAAGDEILAIQPVAPGVVRDPEWEGVVDGEVCGLGPLAESVRTFLHWVPIKLEMKDALQLCVSCADALAQEGEFNCARKFYTFVADSCEGIKRERTALIPPAAEGATPKTGSTCLAQNEASWMARAEFGAASMELRVELIRDPHVQFAATLAKVTTHLRRVQSVMRFMLNRPKDEHDAVSWVVLEGCVILFDWCEPLSALGHGDDVVEFLAWSTLAMESMVSLSTVKHLPWRTRLAVATCYAFEDSGKPAAAAKCAAHALEKVRELRRQEGMDPPIPPNVTETLDVAESDLMLLTFKYATLATAAAKRPLSSTVGETNEGGDNTGGTGDESVAGGLCEENLSGLLDEHIPDTSKRPAALLELIGSGDRRSPPSINGSVGTLTASESSLACKLAVSLLLPPAPEGGEGGEEVTNDAEGGLKKNEVLTGEENIDNGSDEAFPLHIDQEMQLMREMYQLGEFEAWEAMLPSTKRRLRQASQGSLGRNECRAFWFEIALWTSCKRLQTWRDKPEPPKPAEKGGLKRTPPASREGSSKPISSTQTATERSSDSVSGDSGDRSEKERAVSGPSLVLPAAAEEGKGRGLSEGVVAMGAEEELRESLKATRPAEVVEVALGRDGTVGVRVNLTPMLTVVGLLRKALFGHYRHLLESRGEALLGAMMSLWEPYVASILEGLDSLPGEAEIDLPLLDALLLSLETISACLSALNADDESLRATIALRLAILQADFRGDRRKACQTLRSALASIDKHRKGVVCNHLHHATTTDDTNGISSTGSRSSSNTRSNSSRRSSALTRASVTASFHNEAESINTARGNGSDGGGNARGDWEVEADMGFQELAALQLDVTSTLFRVELLMGRDIACQLAKHKKAEAAARLAARRNASKRKMSPNKASKVTFGDSDGRLDTLAGSLAAGWSVVLPVEVGGPGNGSGGSTGGVTKALIGTNAIVCAAGAGPLLTKAAAALEGAKQGGEICLAPKAPAATKGKDGLGPWNGDEIESCPVTEARLTSEFRRNPYCRALLLATMARLSTNRREQEGRGIVRDSVLPMTQAKATEKVLLGTIPAANTGGDDSAAGRRGLSKQPSPNNNNDDLKNNNRRASIRAPPPAPLLVSRSHNCIELLPLLFPASHQHQHGKAAGSKDGRGVDGGDHVVETTLKLSNATSTTAAMSRHAARPPVKARRVVKVCIYGKPEGAGTGVTLSNTHYAGLGVPIPFDQSTGICDAVSIRGLVANESYVFAVAAFDEQGDLIGEGIGEACSPVETLNPLPLPLCWAHLSRTALGLGCSSLAAQAATEVYRELMTLAAGNLLTKRSAKAGRQGVVGRMDNSGATATKDVPTTGGTVTTDLRNGWMASPLVGQGFEPEALDRCPRGVLQAFVQSCFVLVSTADEDAMVRAKSGGGGPLEEQVARLVALKRLSLACEVAVLLQDWDLVARGVWEAYHLLLPLLRVAAMGHLFRLVLCQLHQCLSLVPSGDGWDNVIKSTFACLAYQITIKGHEIGENLIARATLLDHGPDGDHTASAGAVVFKESSPTAPGAGAAEGADEDEGGAAEGETGDLLLKNGTPAQAALLEVWMGLQGYGMGARGEAGGATTVVSKLRKALDLEDPDSATSASPSAGGGGNAGEEDTVVAPVSSLEAVEKVMSCAHKNPAKAWELLQGEAFTSHPDRARLLCRVCWIALDRGMAQQVVSWLDPRALGATGAGTTMEDRAAGGTRAGERGCAHMLAESDLKPLAAKFLALEGGLEDSPYIVPAPGNKDTGIGSVEAAQGIDGGVDNSKGNASGEAAAVTDEGDAAEAERRGTNADPGDRSDRSSNTRGEGDECMGALTLAASAAESEQLLRLAEVEHILGAACLQLGLAAAAIVGASKLATGRSTPNGQDHSLYPQPATSAGAIAANPVSSIPAGVAGAFTEPPPFRASRPTAKKVSAAAGGGRLPWGYGTGPFAEVFASKKGLIVEGGDGGRETSGDGGGDRVGNDGRDEEDIISQLEDDGTPWPSKSQVVSAVEGAVINENSNEEKSTGGNGDHEDGKSADEHAFAVFFSMAMLHLTKAASRARRAHSWSKTERSCGLLWNAILALWLSPQDFRSTESEEICGGWGLPLGEHHGRIYAKACEALLDAVDAAHGVDRGGGRRGSGSNRGSSQESADDDSSQHEGEVGLKAAESAQVSSDLPTPVDSRWVSRFVEWGLQGILRCRCWGVVVKVGSRLLTSTGGLYNGNRVYPLVLHAQKQLCSLADRLLSMRQARLEAVDEKFQEAQAKRRRRKVLKALETKSKEEIEHDRAREPLVEDVGDARVRKQIHDHRLGTLLQSRDNYAKTKEIGRRTLDDARETLVKHLALLSPTPSPLVTSESPTAGDGNVLGEEAANGSVPPTDNGNCGGDGVVGDTPDFGLIEKSKSAVLKVYGRAAGVLRDKRERELLTEALCDMGDLHVLGGHYDSASKSWMDAIDSLCSALDSTKHWRAIFTTLRAAHPSSGGPPEGGGSLALALGRWSCIAGGTLLGKLSRFTGHNDMRGQLNLCLMAAEMFRAPLEISLPYPQRECDYASFTPETLGGPGLESLGLWIDDRRLSVSSLSLSLMHVQGVLVAAGCYKEAFPVQAVLEHVASRVTLDPLHLVRVQLARVECLAEAGFPAEAASALAAVLSGGSTPKTTAGYAGRRDNMNSSKDPPTAPAEAEIPVTGKGKAKKGGGAKGKGGGKPAVDSTVGKDSGVSDGADGGRARDPRDMAKSGLPFYGFAPFQNSLPIGHPDNAPAVSWLMGELPGIGADDTADATGDNGVSGASEEPSRHVRLLKRGLFGAYPTLEELRGENEACLVARARARLLLALADCSAMLPSEDGEGRSDAREGEGDAEVLKRVRDAADSILGEVLQVTFKRISPEAIPTPTAPLDTGRSGKSAATQESSLSVHPDGMDSEKRAATEAAHMAATAPDQPDGWAPPMAADALLMRGRLALLDGKFRVCRHHASRGLAVLLRHGLGGKGGKSFSPHPANGATALMGKLTTGASILSNGRKFGDNDNTDGSIQHAMAMKNASGISGGHSRVMFDDEQRQPWRIVQTWLELRHDLAAVALLQGRTMDAMFQIQRGLDEAHAVGEGVISNRLRRLGAQAAVAEGNLEQAVSDCQALAADYIKNPSTSAVDLAAVLRLMAKIRHQQSLVSGEGDRRQTLLLLSEALDALRIADQALLSAADGLGWIGSGILTYSKREDNIMDADAKPHLLHALGTSFRDLSRELPGVVAFGLAPADESDETAQSSLSNLYLPALRLLLTVRVTLLDILEGVGPHNTEREELERRQSSGSEGDNERSFQQHHEDAKENNFAGTVGTTGERWLAGASSLAEETMALLRHIAHPHPALRAHLLLLVGAFRLRQLKNIQGASSSSSWDPMGSTATSTGADDSAGAYAPTHGSHLPRMGSPDTSMLEAATATALTAALRVSFSRGGHDWRVMSDACMNLVVLYYITAETISKNRESGEHLSDDDKNGAPLHAAGADDGRELHRHKMGLAVHYLRLAAMVSLGHRRLSIELDSIASDPLPAAVIDNMPRSALDELAGRGGRGPEDDPLRLSTRGLLQFLRARVHEKSLAAAPVDLLPASVVCQIHALLYRHVPLYREKCCIQASSLHPPSAPESVGEASSSADVASVLSPAVICVQWIWGDFHGIRARGSSTAGTTLVGADDDGDQTVTGLYSARTAFILLGPGQPNAADEEAGQKGPPSGSEFGPSILVARVLASSADGLRRRASQLKALLSAIEKKTSVDATAAAVESGGPPSSLKDRFNLLLQDAAQALRSGLVAPPLMGPEAEKGTVESELAPTKSKEPAAATEAPGSSSDQEEVMALTVDNVEAVEGVFNTDIGVDVENEQLCCFLRGATTTTTKISASL